MLLAIGIKWIAQDLEVHHNKSSHRLPKIVFQNIIFNQLTIFNLVGTEATFSYCIFNSWMTIQASRATMETNKMRMARKHFKQYMSKKKIILHQSIFIAKIYIHLKDITRQITIDNCEMKKIEFKIGQFASLTYIWVKVTNSIFHKHFDLFSAFRSTFIILDFVDCTIEKKLSINGQAALDDSEDPADIAVSFKTTVIIAGYITINTITSIDVIDCNISGKIMYISGRAVEKVKCCSTVNLENSRIIDTKLDCARVSLNIIDSTITISYNFFVSDSDDATLVTWTSYHGSRFKAIDSTFDARAADLPQTLLNISRKNVVLENVHMVCLVKVTADLHDNKTYRLLCSTQCAQNEYKVSTISSLCIGYVILGRIIMLVRTTFA